MELSKQAREDMKFLGNFSPTVDGKHFKGYMLDADGDGECGKVYLSESDLRYLSRSCLEAAEYLAARRCDGQ